MFTDLGYTRRDELRFEQKKLAAYWYAPPPPPQGEAGGFLRTSTPTQNGATYLRLDPHTDARTQFVVARPSSEHEPWA